MYENDFESHKLKEGNSPSKSTKSICLELGDTRVKLSEIQACLAELYNMLTGESIDSNKYDSPTSLMGDVTICSHLAEASLSLLKSIWYALQGE